MRTLQFAPSRRTDPAPLTVTLTLTRADCLVLQDALDDVDGRFHGTHALAQTLGRLQHKLHALTGLTNGGARCHVATVAIETGGDR
jgi:hypothetical protein